MTHLASRTALFALAFALLASVSACVLTGSCSCPSGGGYAQVTVPAAQSSPIADVSETRPCGAYALDDHTVGVQTNSAGGCQVLVRLQNGDTYTFSVQFVAETFTALATAGPSAWSALFRSRRSLTPASTPPLPSGAGRRLRPRGRCATSGPAGWWRSGKQFCFFFFFSFFFFFFFFFLGGADSYISGTNASTASHTAGITGVLAA